jgi:hypothetical protein
MADWQTELFALLEDDVEKIQTELCLISGEPFEEDYITLSCGHKFNYIPLYNSIYSKYRKGKMDEEGIMMGSMAKLYVPKMECPYCRKNIPYIELPSRGPKFVNIVSKHTQCTAINKNGKPCKLKAIDGRKLCTKHNKNTLEKLIPSSSDDTHIYITQTETITFSTSTEGNPIMIVEIPKEIATLKHSMSQLVIKK